VLIVLKDLTASFCFLQRPDFVFMDDFLAEGLLRLCVHLVKVNSSPFLTVSALTEQQNQLVQNNSGVRN